MYRTILVPLDGSMRAEAVLPHVDELARRYAAKVILLQVVEPIPVGTDASGVTPALNPLLIDQLASDAKAHLAKLQEGSARRASWPRQTLPSVLPYQGFPIWPSANTWT